MGAGAGRRRGRRRRGRRLAGRRRSGRCSRVGVGLAGPRPGDLGTAADGGGPGLVRAPPRPRARAALPLQGPRHPVAATRPPARDRGRGQGEAGLAGGCGGSVECAGATALRTRGALVAGVAGVPLRAEGGGGPAQGRGSGHAAGVRRGAAQGPGRKKGRSGRYAAAEPLPRPARDLDRYAPRAVAGRGDARGAVPRPTGASGRLEAPRRR